MAFRIIAGAALAGAFLLSACSSGDSPTYFPLGGSQHWRYTLVEENPLGRLEQDFDIDNAGTAKRDGERYFLRRTGYGNEYWLKIDGSDVIKTATRTVVEEQPRNDVEAIKVMPLQPKVGDAWSIVTQPYILERAEPFRERFIHDESKRFELRMQVASINEEVTVPAGTFKNVMRIDGEGLINMLADPRVGPTEVPITQTEWYAPGVGLIKFYRKEDLPATQIVGGEVSLELQSFNR